MGAYDDAVKGGSRSMTEAMNLTPWVWRLQEADMCAAWIDERNAAEVWRCDWAEITDAQVWAAEPGDVPVKMPYII